MTQTAIISIPDVREEEVGALISCGVSIFARESYHVDRAYLAVPLSWLSGHASLFSQSDIEIVYFDTRAEAIAWVERDIRRRNEEEFDALGAWFANKTK